MPRLLPRLAQKLKSCNRPSTPEPFSLDSVRFRGKSLWKPPRPVPSLHPAKYSKSILLTPGNPITSSRDYVHRKTLPPRVFVANRSKSRKDCYDRPRKMTEEERRWWSSPYLRMLASPIRRCVLTENYLPSDFFIRLGIMRVPSSRGQRFISPNQYPEAVLMPDGLEHSRFRVRRAGKAVYVLCWKDAFEQLRATGAYKRAVRNVRLHSSLEDQVRHLLRLRVLQELEIAADSLNYRPRHLSHHTLIRRLTREEWQGLKTTGTVPFPNAIAVLVVPPLNRNPQSKKRPECSMSPLPPVSDTPVQPQRPALPTCTIYPASHDASLPEDTHLSKARIPLYHGVTLFPDPAQRTSLYSLLNRILYLERKARSRSRLPGSSGDKKDSGDQEAANQIKASDDRKASHAFLLMSDEHTAKTADMGAVGRALWRIAMFEGLGWEEEPQWVKRSRYRSMAHLDKEYMYSDP